MGRSGDSHLYLGTQSSSQMGLDQLEDELISDEIEREIEREMMMDESLLDELENAGVKFTREDVVFVTHDGTGQIVWLEKGSRSAGLEHILRGTDGTSGHADNFKRALGLQEKEIAPFLYEAIAKGRVISSVLKPIANGKLGYERVYYYEGNYYVVAGVGTNGFIVSAYLRHAN